MARGQQKIQSQQKNAEKQAKLKKMAGTDGKKTAAAALTYTCVLCKVFREDKTVASLALELVFNPIRIFRLQDKIVSMYFSEIIIVFDTQ